MNNTKSKSVLFIPDISGFTRFVNDIEILHGQEITAELLEEIINADELDLEVSEIEGDAVLFYKIGEPISLEKIYSQAVKTLQRFHLKKDQVQQKRVCQCNACNSVNHLKLKFILHFDQIHLIKIKKFTSLFGKGVIIAHRLMKNKIKNSEYILFTKDYPMNYSELSGSIKIIPIEQEIEGLGKIECRFIKLDLPN